MRICYAPLNEDEIKAVQENVCFWLLEEERYPGEQQKKLDTLERLVGRTIDREL